MYYIQYFWKYICNTCCKRKNLIKINNIFFDIIHKYYIKNYNLNSSLKLRLLLHDN